MIIALSAILNPSERLTTTEKLAIAQQSPAIGIVYEKHWRYSCTFGSIAGEMDKTKYFYIGIRHLHYPVGPTPRVARA